jgi:hypothetical protein
MASFSGDHKNTNDEKNLFRVLRTEPLCSNKAAIFCTTTFPKGKIVVQKSFKKTSLIKSIELKDNTH